MKQKRAGVLALQGDFIEHKKVLESIGIKAVEVRTPESLDNIEGLIIPGGESTAIMKLMRRSGIISKLVSLAKRGLPVFGTCAGAIILAKNILNSDGSEQKGLGLIDITIKRNDYGRQLDSFEEKMIFRGKNIKGAFIRAPIIKKTGRDVEILIKNQGIPVACRQKNIIVSTFHPELYDETLLHRFFLSIIRKK